MSAKWFATFTYKLWNLFTRWQILDTKMTIRHESSRSIWSRLFKFTLPNRCVCLTKEHRVTQTINGLSLWPVLWQRESLGSLLLCCLTGSKGWCISIGDTSWDSQHNWLEYNAAFGATNSFARALRVESVPDSFILDCWYADFSWGCASWSWWTPQFRTDCRRCCCAW